MTKDEFIDVACQLIADGLFASFEGVEKWLYHDDDPTEFEAKEGDAE